MNSSFIVGSFILFTFYSCKNSTKRQLIVKPISSNNVLKNKGGKKIDTIPQAVFGYRFSVTGDFDGDGKKETLTEHFFSRIDNKETNKFYDNIADYDQLVELTMKKKPYSFITCDNKHIKTLPISSNDQLLGLAYLKNEGDLDGDGADEISYVVDWADWSNLNTWNIMTYKHGKWKKLYSFSIWDWQLPDMPQTFNQYGLIGRENKITVNDDTINKRIEQNYNNFKGLVKKIANNKIQIIYQNDNAELDTTIIALRKPKISKYSQ